MPQLKWRLALLLVLNTLNASALAGFLDCWSGVAKFDQSSATGPNWRATFQKNYRIVKEKNNHPERATYPTALWGRNPKLVSSLLDELESFPKTAEQEDLIRFVADKKIELLFMTNSDNHHVDEDGKKIMIGLKDYQSTVDYFPHEFLHEAKHVYDMENDPHIKYFSKIANMLADARARYNQLLDARSPEAKEKFKLASAYLTDIENLCGRVRLLMELRANQVTHPDDYVRQTRRSYYTPDNLHTTVPAEVMDDGRTYMAWLEAAIEADIKRFNIR